VADANSAAVNLAVTNLAAAVIGSMVDGQEPQTLISENARFVVRRDLASDAVNSSLSAPQTEAER
jgi:hypothetical protein